jgi:hypothetical protein
VEEVKNRQLILEECNSFIKEYLERNQLLRTSREFERECRELHLPLPRVLPGIHFVAQAPLYKSAPALPRDVSGKHCCTCPSDGCEGYMYIAEPVSPPARQCCSYPSPGFYPVHIASCVPPTRLQDTVHIAASAPATSLTTPGRHQQPRHSS